MYQCTQNKRNRTTLRCAKNIWVPPDTFGWLAKCVV